MLDEWNSFANVFDNCRAGIEIDILPIALEGREVVKDVCKRIPFIKHY
jgi:hypothetical protein